MGGAFDPYYRWLGIPPAEQPPNLYRLLGIALFEEDVEVIDAAANRQMGHLRTYQTGPHGPLSQQLLNEVAAARVTLLNAAKKVAYDQLLRHELAAAGQASAPVVEAVPAETDIGLAPLFEEPAAPVPPSPRDSLPTVFPAVAPETPLHASRPNRKPLMIAAFAGTGLVIVVGGIAVWLAGGGSDPEPDNRPGTKPSVASAAQHMPTAEPPATAAAPREFTLQIDWPEPLRAGGRLEIDGRPVPIAPRGPISLRLPQGERRVVATRPGFKPFQWRVSLSEDTVARSTPQWEPLAPAPAANPATLPSSTPLVNVPSAETPASQPPRERIAVPSKEERQAVVDQIEDLYKLSELSDNDARRRVARELFELAGQTTDSPGERFVLLQKAAELAADGGDLALVTEAIDTLDDEYAIDLPTVRAWAWERVARAADDPSDIVTLIEKIQPLLEQLLADGEIAAAEKLLALLEGLASGPLGSTLTGQLDPVLERDRRQVAWCRAAEAARATLVEKPDDPEANLTVGRWLALGADRWPEGLVHLAKGSDPALAGLARREQAGAEPPVALADAWWDASESRDGDEQTAFRRRAAHWYATGWSELAGLERLKATKRFDVLMPALADDDPVALAVLDRFRQTAADSAVASSEREEARGRIDAWQKKTVPTGIDAPAESTAATPTTPTTPASGKSVDDLIRAGWDFVRSGKNREAGETLLEASRTNRDDIRGDFSLGLLEALVGKNPGRAAEHFERCVARAEKDVPSLNNHAIALVRESMFRQAVRDWTVVLELGPPPREVVQNVGRFCWLAQNKRLAVPVSLTKPVTELWEKVQAAAGGHSFSTQEGFLYMPYAGPGAGEVGWSDPSVYHDRMCIACDGHDLVPCPARGCNRGSVRVMKTRVTGRNPINGMVLTESYAVREPCPACKGRGAVDCPFCKNGVETGL